MIHNPERERKDQRKRVIASQERVRISEGARRRKECGSVTWRRSVRRSLRLRLRALFGDPHYLLVDMDEYEYGKTHCIIILGELETKGVTET